MGTVADLQTTTTVNRRNFLHGVGASSAIGAASISGCLDTIGVGSEGEYPDGSMRFVVPFEQGSSVDVYDRRVGDKMSGIFDVTMEYDYVTGGVGMAGSAEVMNSEPDGYTLGHFNYGGIGVVLVNEPEYNITEADFIGSFNPGVWVVIGNPDAGFETFDEMVELYRDGTLTEAAGNNPSAQTHLTWNIWKENDEFDIPWEDYIAYAGSGDIIQAVTSGEVPAGIVPDTVAGGPVEDGQVNGIASVGSRGTGTLPDLPTLPDLGYPNIDYVGQFFMALFTAPGTPEDRVETLTETLEEALQSDELEEWSEETGNSVEFLGGPEETLESVEQGFEEIPQQVDLDQFRDE